MLSFWDYKRELVFPTELFIRKEEADIDCFFDQLYDAKKFRRWFKQQPFVDIRFDGEKFDVGNNAKFIFRCLPFTYQARCTKVVRNERIEAVIYGNVTGYIKVKFTETEDGWHMHHVLALRGNTMLTHMHYLAACSLPHIPFMILHFRKLKQMAIMDTKRKGG